jgi:uncharacterized spore protein YtfJ
VVLELGGCGVGREGRGPYGGGGGGGTMHVVVVFVMLETDGVRTVMDCVIACG